VVIAGLAAAAILNGAATPSVSPQDLVEVTDISSLATSPDGKLVAFRTAQPSIGDNQIHLKWYVAPVDGSAPARMVADGGGPEIDSGIVLDQLPVWAPSSQAFFVRAEFDGETQFWRISVDGGAPRQLSHDPADVRSLALSNDRRSLRYEIGATRDEVARAERTDRDQGVLINGKVDVTSPLALNGVADGHPATLRFGPGWFHRLPLLSGEPLRTKTLTLEPGDGASIEPAAPAPAIRVTIERRAKQAQLRATGSDGVEHVCRSGACAADAIIAATPMMDGRDVLVTTRDIALRETLSIWTPSTARWKRLAGGEGLLDSGNQMEDPACGLTARVAVCVAAGASEPPRLVSIDISTGTERALFDPNGPLRARAWPARTIIWTTADGRTASGQLFLPLSAKPQRGYPLVMNYYRCAGFLKGGLGDELPLAPLAEAGVATLCINAVDGFAGSEPAQEARAIDAITSIVDKLDQQGLVDRSRIGMAGLSFGSGIVLTIAERTRLLRAAAISSGQIEPYYYWAFRLPGLDVRDELKSFYGLGDPDTDATGWKDHTFVGHVDAIKAPLLIQIPESEMRITMEFFSRLAASSTPAEMFAFPNETHVKWEPRHKLTVYERNLDWFRFWLQGVEDADPAKAEQYARWRSFSARPGYALATEDHLAPALRVP